MTDMKQGKRRIKNYVTDPKEDHIKITTEIEIQNKNYQRKFKCVESK